MKHFDLIALICLFQSIRFSLACNGFSAEVIDLQFSPENNIKFDLDKTHFELTNDCQAKLSSYVTIKRPYKSSSISVKVKNDFTELLKLKKTNLCKFLTDYKIFGMECFSEDTGAVGKEFGGSAEIKEYAPFLPFLTGNFTLFAKIYYDDDDQKPDKFALVVNIKATNSMPSWF